MEYPSKLIEEAVHQIAKLPGVGKKTALRLALHLLREEEEESRALADAIINLRTQTQYCKFCHNLADEEVCVICASHKRDRSLVCVVERSTDLMAIENTSQYQGLYHVLGGVISPMDGIGPDELNLDSLVERIANSQSEIKEIILALSATMEGDTTAFYITRKLKDFNVKMSTIARGVPIGSELEYTDEITLGRSIITRTGYESE